MLEALGDRLDLPLAVMAFVECVAQPVDPPLDPFTLGMPLIAFAFAALFFLCRVARVAQATPLSPQLLGDGAPERAFALEFFEFAIPHAARDFERFGHDRFFRGVALVAVIAQGLGATVCFVNFLRQHFNSVAHVVHRRLEFRDRSWRKIVIALVGARLVAVMLPITFTEIAHATLALLRE